MLSNYLAVALRNLARTRFYSVVGIVVLAVGLSAAILMALCVRAQLSYERFIPGYERIYLAATVEALAGQAPVYDMKSPGWLAGLLKLKFADIDTITRIADQEVRVRRGETEARETIYWADRNVFDVLPLPALRGDLRSALDRPDGIVLSRSMARKYFGHEEVVGQSLQLDGTHAMTVTAVIEDLPADGTMLMSGIFASGLASHSLLTQYDRDPKRTPGGGLSWDVLTYFRLAPNASIESVQDAMQAFAEKAIGPAPMPGLRAYWQFIRTDHVHRFPGFNPGLNQRIAMAAMLGLLILLMACAVFVNLSTARMAERALEVGVRKTCGANRGAVVLQFLCESLLQVMVATVVALALVELLLPSVNVFTRAGAVFDYWRHPWLIAGAAGCALMTGVLVGAYPAFALSSLRPTDVLKRTIFSDGAARQVLVTLQFSVLIGLVVIAGVIYRQHFYAMNESLRVNANRVLIIRSPCNPTFKDELRALVGVRAAFCSDPGLLNGITFANFRLKDGSQHSIGMTVMESGVFDLYELKPVAGKFSVGDEDAAPQNSSQYVINESAIARLGFASPAAAIGQPIAIREGDGSDDIGEVIGVVPDFSLGSVEQRIKPSVYRVTRDSHGNGLISAKLTGAHIPDTLAAIDKLWRRTGASEPIDRFFLNEYLQNLYLVVLRQAQMFAIFSGVALLLAGVGMVGLAVSATQRRTKEIGIRKAMGAGVNEVMRLLLWQFAKPVLWATLIAWPVAAFVMNRWLQGFAYHIDLEPWIFVASSVLALVIALVTVSAHCYLVAREKPVHALRYE